MLVCKNCGASFTRKNSFSLHTQACSRLPTPTDLLLEHINGAGSGALESRYGVSRPFLLKQLKRSPLYDELKHKIKHYHPTVKNVKKCRACKLDIQHPSVPVGKGLVCGWCVASGDKEMQKCQRCGIEFKNQNGLDRHMKACERVPLPTDLLLEYADEKESGKIEKKYSIGKPFLLRHIKCSPLYEQFRPKIIRKRKPKKKVGNKCIICTISIEHPVVPSGRGPVCAWCQKDCEKMNVYINKKERVFLIKILEAAKKALKPDSDLKPIIDGLIHKLT